MSIKHALMVLSRKIKSAGLVFLFLTSPVGFPIDALSTSAKDTGTRNNDRL